MNKYIPGIGYQPTKNDRPDHSTSLRVGLIGMGAPNPPRGGTAAIAPRVDDLKQQISALNVQIRELIVGLKEVHTQMQRVYEEVMTPQEKADLWHRCTKKIETVIAKAEERK